MRVTPLKSPLFFVVRVALLACIPLTAACANLKNYYDPADQEGAAANLIGTYYFPGAYGPEVVKVRQDGSRATMFVEAMNKHSRRDELHGEVQGRVLLASSPSTECVLTLDRAGLKARIGWAGGPWSGTEATATRLSIARTGEYPSTKADPLLSGGDVCQLPGPKGTSRLVLVFLEHVLNEKGSVSPTRTFVPLESPRKVWKTPYPGDALFAHVLDRGFLLTLRAGSPLYQKQSVSLDGKPAWIVMAPGWTEQSQDLDPSRFQAEVYLADPAAGGLPSEVVEVAERTPPGEWRPQPHYLMSSSSLTLAQAVLEGGRPVRVELVQPSEPPLEEFLVLEEKVLSQARWRNQALLEVKNRTLPKILRDSKTAELTALSIRLEKLLLDLSHESDRLRDRAQRNVEGSTLSVGEVREDKREIAQIRSQLADPNIEEATRARLEGRIRELERNVARLQREQGTSQSAVDEMREMSTVYRERIEVLKPFLAAIKEEGANRGK